VCSPRSVRIAPCPVPKEVGKTLVIQDDDKSLAVLLRYEHFMAMQELIRSKEI
jgi:hypothetical protein